MGSAKAMASWDTFKPILSSILALLGHKGLRDRYMQTCLSEEPSSVRRLFKNWRFKVVDWKWEYMEKTFAQLSPAIEIFLDRFDEHKLKIPIGAGGPEISAETIDPACLVKIKEAKQDKHKLATIVEAFHVFSRQVGRETRWFGGCCCHDHIWRKPLTDQAKLRLFQKEEGSHLRECVWRGRRSSELARGYWRQQAARVRNATSAELHFRLTHLPGPERAYVVEQFEMMKTRWAEEILVKYAYWDELPHLILAMYPNDHLSQSFAVKVLAKWEAVLASGKLAECHRVTYRMLHAASSCGFAPSSRSWRAGKAWTQPLRSSCRRCAW